MPGHPRSLANLRSFKPGTSGNPAGRKTAGAYIREWFNAMVGWKHEKVKKVLDDDKAPMGKRIAARQMLDAMEDGTAIDRICDRTEGKPKQHIDQTIDGNIQLTAAEARNRVACMFGLTEDN